MGVFMIKYEDIKVPCELYSYMLNIKYGYLTYKNDIIVNDKIMFKGDFWYENYMLQDTNDMLRTGVGICYDQVEFARCWFINNGYDVRTYYEQMGDDMKSSHVFLAYYDNKWKWFETTWKNRLGIHEYGSLDELVRDSVSLYMNELIRDRFFGIGDLALWSFDTPKKHSSLDEYIDNVIDGKILSLKMGG